MDLNYKYHQPSFYHFSSDSIELSNFASEYYNDKAIAPTNILDICSGSGVVAIETVLKLNRSPQSITLVELQEEFESSLFKNCKELIPEINSNIIISDFTILKLETSFDLILMNPPYFSSSSGRSSPDVNRRICREYDNDLLVKLVNRSLERLSANGHFFIVFRDEDQLCKIDGVRVIKHRDFKGFGLFEILPLSS